MQSVHRLIILSSDYNQFFFSLGPHACAMCSLPMVHLPRPHYDLLMLQYLKLPVPLQLLIVFRTVSSISTGNNTHTLIILKLSQPRTSLRLCTVLECRCVPAHLVCAAQANRTSVVLLALFLCSSSKSFPSTTTFHILLHIVAISKKLFISNRVLVSSLV